MFRLVLLGVVLAALVAGCSKTTDMSARAADTNNTNKVTGASAATLTHATAARSLLILPEDVFTVSSNALTAGPPITGSVQPVRRADLRAEVSAVVLQVLKDNGDPVRRGDLLVRLDDLAIRDSLGSAEASARAAAQAYEQAERQFQRLIKLREAGMASTQAVEDVEIRRNNAQSELEAAKTRAVVARQQLQRTESRAPFDGIVSDRKVSAGDTAQIGKELLKIIDPRSMRFEGMVSADNIGEVKAGQRVVFRVHGYVQQDFIGKITRLNPAANITTRQVEVMVDFVDARQQPTLAGLYAEGRVETGSATQLTIPATAIVNDGKQTFVWRLKDKALQKAGVVIGERDVRSGEFALKSGLAVGDMMLRYPNATLTDGQQVEMAAASTSVSDPS